MAQRRPRGQAEAAAVAIMDFDYGTVDNWWGQYDIGKGMADQVVDALVNDGTFRVIERKKLDTVLAEQDFAHSDRADPSAAKLAKVGKVLGVKYIIAGSITKFATESRGGAVRRQGHRRSAAKKAKSEVNVTARIIDATTGEIMRLGQGRGRVEQGRRRQLLHGRRRRSRHELRGVAPERPRRRPGAGLQRPRGPARR